ncbi:MAG: PKD domain-containing protein, partial [Thermoplasmata archaeon]|nr:PKD domain-containing protein [Thermoplasmata archaeon]
PASRRTVVVALAALAFLLAPALLAATWGPAPLRPTDAAQRPPPSVLASPTPVLASLLNGTITSKTSSAFWSLVVQTNCPTCIASQSKVGAFLNQTSFVWFRYSQQSDQCNIAANVQYTDNGSVMGVCGYNISAFKQWCSSRGTSCHSILDLPAENNNSAEDATIAKYIVKTVGFQPDYWSIGNEPTGWKHYGIPWTQWSTSDNSVPTPLAYAYDVKATIAAVRAVDPSGKFIGIQAACECNTGWFQAVTKLNGPNLSAIAYHTYPSTALSTSVTLQQFYDPLASSANITTSVQTVRTAITGSCTQCASLPILVDEFNAGPGWAPSNYAGSYANAVFLAASTVQALRANVTQLSVFDLQTYSTTQFGFSMMGANYSLAPTGRLYSQLLNHLARGTVLGVNVRTAVPSVWAVVSENSTTESLLVVNANLTQSVALALGTAFPTAVTGTTYQWTSGMTRPSSTNGTLGLAFTIPSQGILLLNAPRPAGVPLPGATPTAAVRETPASGTAPLTVQFSGSATGGVAPYSFAWTFGDGTTGTGASPSHVYRTTGSFTARLTVTDSLKGTGAATAGITVHPPTLAVTVTPSTVSGPAPMCVNFSAQLSGGTAPYTVAWTFGSVAKGSGAVVSHCFFAAGTATVVATVTDASGRSASALAAVTITPPLSVQLSLSQNPAPVGTSVTVSAAVSGASGLVEYAWSSNGHSVDSGGSSFLFPTAKAGDYTLTVTVTDGTVRSANATTTLGVSAKLAPNPAAGPLGLPVFPGGSVGTWNSPLPFGLIALGGAGLSCLAWSYHRRLRG